VSQLVLRRSLFAGSGLPGPPRSVNVLEISPTTVLLDIQPPGNTGGVDIYGFRVQYLLKIDDFMIGIFSLYFFFCILGLLTHCSYAVGHLWHDVLSACNECIVVKW